MLVAAIPFALVKEPPTKKVPFETASALTPPLRPYATGNQRVPSHLAMPTVEMPPMVKLPPPYRLVPETAKAVMVAFVPNPDQLVPSHLAIRFTITEPAAKKSPLR